MIRDTFAVRIISEITFARLLFLIEYADETWRISIMSQ